MVSRSEGYRRALGKEEGALTVAAKLMREVVGVELRRIEDRAENYERGDFRAPSGCTLECKGQPIDPVKYPQNFVEVFEETRNADHASGLSELAVLLDMSEEQLAAARVRDRRRPPRGQTKVGRVPNVSVSIHTFAAASYVIYVNTFGRVVYVYDSRELLNLIREAVRVHGFQRGMGRSNEDTYAVLVGLPSAIWRGDMNGWTFTGTGDREGIIAGLRAALA